jgi:hypothetical protein
VALSKLSERRLTTLIGFLEALPPQARKHFDMRWWVSHKGDGERTIGHHGIQTGQEITKKKLLVECGLAACAMGWAAMIPAFKKAGLHLAPRKHYGGATILSPIYEGKENFEAGMKFFDLNDDQANMLFHPDVPAKTPAAWAARARKKLQEWKKQA